MTKTPRPPISTTVVKRRPSLTVVSDRPAILVEIPGCPPPHQTQALRCPRPVGARSAVTVSPYPSFNLGGALELREFFRQSVETVNEEIPILAGMVLNHP